MFTDPAACGRQGATEPPAAARGRRRFGDACLAHGDSGPRAQPRPSSQAFLRPAADGVIHCQILLLPGFELNELAALVETFAAVNRLLRQPRFAWRLASLDGGPVTAAGGLSIAVVEAATAGDAPHHFILSA